MRVPEIVGDTWFNSRPLTGDDLRGKVVLVDFWTYSCVNCLRTIPHLGEWWRRYKDNSFLIIGIHAPEFEFEKDPANVAQAIKDLDIQWPVVLDNDRVNWLNFANQYWPAKYLVDRDGNIVYEHFGEGGYDKTEKKIVEQLGRMAGENVPDYEIEEDHGGACFVTTPEIYCGYGRGALSNPAGYTRDKAADYARPDEIDDDSIALSGKFLAAAEYVESLAPGAALHLRFRATEVNLVLKPGNGSAKIRLALDGAPPRAGVAGFDVDPAGVVAIHEPRMYNLLRSDDLIAGPDFAESILTLESTEGRFQAFAFTFSGCKDIVRTGQGSQ